MSTGIQGEPFDSPERRPHGSPDGASKRAGKKARSWRTLAGTGALVAFGLLVLVLLYSFIHRTFIDPPVQPQVTRDGKPHIIQLDVLNGSGEARLAQRFTDYLRARGFDVVEMGNYKESGVAFTRVIDRTGDRQAAEQVARALGVAEELVTQQIDRNAYLDVTVVIGKDFRGLKPLQ